MLVLEIGVSVRVGVRVRVRDAWDTKRLGTKRIGYVMSGSLQNPATLVGESQQFSSQRYRFVYCHSV